jgi:tetratricopeptide (TPR) repeat protein
VTGTVVVHICYYTLIIGGDHFEYRVFSYLIPLIFISMLWLVNRLTRDAMMAAAALALLIIVSWPVQWTHWLLTRNLNTRDETWILRMPIAEEFPIGLRWYAETFDGLQSWLIEHHVCMRHQEHKVFYEFWSSRFPKRSLQVPAQAGEFPIAYFESVGVPGWVFPSVAILDGWGLNDYVIARHKARPHRMRYMAHDRFPPPGYIESFSVNYSVLANRSSGFIHREFEITAEDIKTNEQFWIDRIVRGVDRPFPYAMLNRMGESLVRLDEPDSALMFFREALVLDSSEARVYINLGRCFNVKGATDSAIFYLKRACTLEPNNPLAVTRLGCAYAAIGYAAWETDSARSHMVFATAESYLHRALGLDSSQVEALVELASIGLFSGQLDSSATYLSLLENRATGAPEELHLLGDRYIFKERRDLAVRAYRLAIRNGLNTVTAAGLMGKFVELARPARDKQLTE